MEIIVFCLLAAWFAVYRGTVDAVTMGRRSLGWIAERAAGGADRLAVRSPKLGVLVGRWARSLATWLRARPAPTAPRTADGQKLLNAAGGLAAVGMALLLVWMRLAVVDAIGAAHAAVARGYALWRFPQDGEPGAPIRVTAQRTDRPPPPALPAGTTSVTFTFTHNNPN